MNQSSTQAETAATAKPAAQPAAQAAPAPVETAAAAPAPLEQMPVMPPATQPTVGPEGLPAGGEVLPTAAWSVLVLTQDPEGNLVRTWPVSVSYHASGDVPAGPTYWPNLDKTNQRSDLVNVVWEPTEFLVNIGLLPFRAVMTPPWKKIIYSPVGPPGEEHVIYGQPAIGQ